MAAGQLTLMDEVLTPDSSRFWPADSYRVGTSPPSFDKQYLRDYLESLDWNKQAPGPALPAQSLHAPATSISKPCSDSPPKATSMSNWPWDHLDAVVFSRASGRPGVLRRVARIGRYPYAVLRDVAGGQINMRATALVFTTVLSLVPLLAFSFIIIRELGGHHAGRDLQPIVLEFFRPVGAGADDMTRRCCSSPAACAAESWARWASRFWHGRSSERSRRSRTASITYGGYPSPAASRAAWRSS